MKMLSTLAEHSIKALSVLVQKMGMAGPVTPQICAENQLQADLLVMLLTSLGSLAPASLALTSSFHPGERRHLASGIFGKSFLTELFGFHLHLSLLSQTMELHKRRLDAGSRGGVGQWVVTSSHTAPEPGTTPV